MRFHAGFWLILTFYLVIAQPGLAQIPVDSNEKENRNDPRNGFVVLTQQDSIRQSNLPELKLPERYRNQVLPEWVDNSQLPYFRPIFNQTGFECSQSAGVGYTFTYEIDRLRNLPANIPENQYPTHFAFNWYNQGTGSACSFFDSWDIIQYVGTPTITEYGGTPDFGGEKRWMNGYDLYYSAMKNRLWEFYSISLKDEEGLLTLKHWINDHLDGSETGGVASIYCAYSTVNDQLPQGTPEAGKYVIPELESPANHAVCIVGYHDSIRWDYNNDGQFTNHLDINNDGLIDYRDWEIGGVKIANSYAMTNWGNYGFAYLTYNALCRTMAQNGIWNQAANVVFAKENTNPQLTYKITLTHNSRYNIRVMAGISSQPNATEPEYVLGFPILNYQGGPFYMQGGTSEEDKTLEFGLDVTALLSYMEPGEEATFFLMVDENDPGNTSTGQINLWSVMDYTNGLYEIPYSQTNIPLVENGLTMLKIGTPINFTPPSVADVSLPPATVNEPYENQMSGTQGEEPYRWWLHQNYSYSYSNQDFPEISAEELFPTGTNSGYAEKEIGFDFPFYGNTYSTFYLHTDGYLMFEENELPWIFVVEDLNVLKNIPCIAPYMARVLGTEGGGMWYEGNAEKATFRWKAIENGTGNVLNFAVSLYPSGKIEFYYGTIAFAGWNRWYAGISNGDGYNYKVLDISNTFGLEPNLKATLQPEFDFTEMALSRDGLFHGTPAKSYNETPVTFYIQDANGLRNVKTLPFSTDKVNRIIISKVAVEAGNDSIIEFGENVSLSVELKNVSSEMVDASLMKISVLDEFVILTDSLLDLTAFSPGETKTFAGAFAFDVENDVPDAHPINFDTKIIALNDDFDSQIHLEAFSPELLVSGYSLNDGNNSYPEPGDTLTLSVQVKNAGGAKAHNVKASLHGSNPYVNIISDEATIGAITGYNAREAVFVFCIDGLVPDDYSILFRVEAVADSGFYAEKTVVIKVGNLVEDAETGDFSLIDWQFAGASPWQIDQESPFEGQYCLKSGAIDHNRFSEMSVTLNVISDGEIRFYNKVSCQPDYDFLTFSIDGIITGLWSGETGYAEHVFPVKAGERTFSWTYTKDHTIAGGSDAAWIDNIVFPACTEEKPVITAGADNVVCIDQTAQLDASAYLANAFVWNTAGDGTFDNENILTPAYLPGPQDVSAGSVQLLLQATGTTGAILRDSLSVFLQDYPTVWAGQDTLLCADDDWMKVSGEATNVSIHLWLTSGDGSFGNPNNLVTFYYPGTDDYSSGVFSLTLIGFPITPCETGLNHSILVSVEPLPEVAFDSIGNFCNTAPAYRLIQGRPEGGVYSGPSVNNGWFYPSIAGIGSHFLAYTFTNEAGCSNTALRQVNVVECLGIEDNQPGKLVIVPNPGKGIFRISGISMDEKDCLLTVHNAMGDQILEQQIHLISESPFIIDLSTQYPGIYWVMLQAKNQVLSGKIVVVR